jgi:hypothetical protein
MLVAVGVQAGPEEGTQRRADVRGEVRRAISSWLAVVVAIALCLVLLLSSAPGPAYADGSGGPVSGVLRAWGENRYNQLGDGTHASHPVPVPVPDLDGVTAISASFSHSLALRSDGTVWAWGSNREGQLGDGATHSACRADRGPVDCSRLPVNVPGLTDVATIAAGGEHSLALIPGPDQYAW